MATCSFYQTPYKADIIVAENKWINYYIKSFLWNINFGIQQHYSYTDVEIGASITNYTHVLI